MSFWIQKVYVSEFGYLGSDRAPKVTKLASISDINAGYETLHLTESAAKLTNHSEISVMKRPRLVNTSESGLI